MHTNAFLLPVAILFTVFWQSQLHLQSFSGRASATTCLPLWTHTYILIFTGNTTEVIIVFYD